jgi:hypothetical protein
LDARLGGRRARKRRRDQAHAIAQQISSRVPTVTPRGGGFDVDDVSALSDRNAEFCAAARW